MGAWIEIVAYRCMGSGTSVAPLVGAWIEIPMYGVFRTPAASLPLWERGLKYYSLFYDLFAMQGRSPCGSVD